MSLFTSGDFSLHSGGNSFWKIECDALTDNDWKTLARIISSECYNFGEVYGVPRGGLKLAEALRPHVMPRCNTVLIVDDVLTTGHSMEVARQRFAGRAVVGVVVFARGPVPPWVDALFTTRLNS